jgi:hypothetical protein
VEESGVRVERDLPDMAEALENLFLFVDEVSISLSPFLSPSLSPSPSLSLSLSLIFSLLFSLRRVSACLPLSL